MRRSQLLENIFLIGGDLIMLPFNPGGHAAYQNHVVTNLRKYYPNPSLIPKSTWDIIERFFALDLTQVDILMKGRYSVFGPEPRLPSCMLRSDLLSLEFKITSVTNWAAAMKTCPLYAFLSGFDVGDTPGVGTFYDFFDRLWISENDNFSPHLRQPKVKNVKNPGKKGSKADPVEKTTVDELLESLSLNPVSDDQPYSLLFHIYKEQFLDISVQNGLVSLERLSVSGDGTSVYTSSMERKKRICNCLDSGVRDCECNRYYSQPDCNTGWDSLWDCYYFGYNLYVLVDSASCSDLPVFPLFHPASRHDSHAFVYSFFTMKAFIPDCRVEKLLLDSAHDAMAIYEYCRKNKISPFIDLNDKRGQKVKYKTDLLIDKRGIPYCPAGLKMRRDGPEPSKYRLKFRCPQMSRKYGNNCANPCSDADFGRTVHLPVKDNPRLFNIPARDTQEWKQIYNGRTSSERSNKRQKIDFLLENGNHRSSKMWYCRLYCIMMLQHLNAWGLSSEHSLKSLVTQAA